MSAQKKEKCAKGGICSKTKKKKMKIHYHASEKGKHFNGIVGLKGRKTTIENGFKLARKHAKKRGFSPLAVKSVTILPY